MVKQKIIKIAVGAILLLFILSIGGYICRGSLLRHLANQRIERLEQLYGLDIHYAELRMKGLNTVSVNRLSVVPAGRDTLLTLQSLDLRIALWKLLWGDVIVKNVQLDGFSLNFVKEGSTANYDFLFRPSSIASSREQKSQSSDFTRRTNTTMSLLFGLLPANGEITRLNITERKDSNFVTFAIPRFAITDHHFESEISIREDSLSQKWTTKGELNPAQRTVRLSLHAPQLTVPYIRRRFGAEVQFDSLSFSFVQEITANGLTRLIGQSEVHGLNVYHKRLFPEVINLNRGQLDFHLNVGRQVIELDSTSLIRFNALTLHPYLKAERALDASSRKKEWHLTASVHKPWFASDELFGSLPKGLFDNIEGIRTSGQLAYRFLLDVDFARLDSLKFESELKEKEFRILSYGRSNLAKMSDEFEYTAYEQGQPVRTFTVGPSCQHFTALNEIPALLQMSVMQSEDGAFFYHRGFLPDAMREALVHDLKVHRFARGGSTISMQLIKNVFLNRNKNIARKLEEALIVWLIENKRLTSKERMYEVYLNIIEWGPLVYGIAEASRFYFDKHPSQLNAEECIYLASIIPRPKHFTYSFTKEGQLRESQEGYFRLIAERLVKKGLIDEAQAAEVNPANVVLKGKAKDYFSEAAEESETPSVDEPEADV